MRLKDSNQETEKPLDNKKTKAKQIKKISKSGEEKIETKVETNANLENNEVVLTDKKDEIEVNDEPNNARKKRRRSSASL